MALDPLYIPLGFFVNPMLDKLDGTPLSGGVVTFYEDDQRATKKAVYQLTGTPGSYAFVALDNPLTLSESGTFVDGSGNQIIPYAYPYDDSGAEQLYYITVYSEAGSLQYTLNAQPHLYDSGSADSANTLVNELSNPQFARVNFDTSAGAYTYTVGAGSNSIDIAPDWVIDYSSPAGGTVIVEQILPQGVENVITNPAAILSINSTGLNTLRLRQRLTGSPNLWGNGKLAGTFVGKTLSPSPVLTPMFYSQSNGSLVDQNITYGELTTSYQAYPNYVALDTSSSTQTFPSAYVDIYIDLDPTTTTFITSVMVAFTGDVIIPAISYDQESYARQVDHLYHYDYPIVPIGTIIDYGGFYIPSHFLLCDGTAYSRETYFLLFQALTTTESVDLTNTVDTFTVVSASNYHIGMAIEGNGIPAATTISNIVGTTITMSAAATATVTSTVTFFAWGDGDGSTTFNVPDLRDYVVAGANGSLFGTGNNAVGANGGSATDSVTLTTANMPSSVGTTVGGVNLTGQSGSSFNLFGAVSTSAIAGLGTAFTVNIVQKTAFSKKCIRYE